MNRITVHLVSAAVCVATTIGARPVAAVTPEWVRQFNSGGDSYGVSANGLGNVYISGFTGATNFGIADAFVRKYDATGNVLWTRQLGTGDVDWATAVSADGAGNVYISGITHGNLGPSTGGGDDAYVSKYDADGNLQWVRQFGTAYLDWSDGVSADRFGNVYVSGITYGPLVTPGNVSADVFLRKYNANGDVLWTRQLGSSDQRKDNEGTVGHSGGVSADLLGNVYVVGTTEGDLGGGPICGDGCAFVAKYNAAGNLLWTQKINNNFGVGFGVSTDGMGNVYISGSLFVDASSRYEAFVSKFDASGNSIWYRTFGSAGIGDWGFGISADGLGNVYLSGRASSRSGAVPGIDDAFVVKYDADGALQWTYGLTTPASDVSYGVSADGLGNVYVTGNTGGNLGDPNASAGGAFLAKFTDIPVPEPHAYLLAALMILPAIAVFRRRARMQKLLLGGILHIVLSSSLAHANLADGLISYWPFDGSGADASGFSRNLTLQGGVGFASGLFGQALDLHGNNSQYAGRPGDDAIFDFGLSDFTVQIWVNYNSTVREQTLIEKFNGVGPGGWTLTSLLEGAGPSTGQAHFFAIEGALQLHSESLPIVQGGIWHQFLVRRQGSRFDLLYDGVIVDTDTNVRSITDTSMPLILGRRNAADARDFSVDGRLDEAAIWNRALSNNEIAFLYNGGVGNPVIPEPNTTALVVCAICGLVSQRASPRARGRSFIRD